MGTFVWSLPDLSSSLSIENDCLAIQGAESNNRSIWMKISWQAIRMWGVLPLDLLLLPFCHHLVVSGGHKTNLFIWKNKFWICWCPYETSKIVIVMKCRIWLESVIVDTCVIIESDLLRQLLWICSTLSSILFGCWAEQSTGLLIH